MLPADILPILAFLATLLTAFLRNPSDTGNRNMLISAIGVVVVAVLLFWLLAGFGPDPRANVTAILHYIVLVASALGITGFQTLKLLQYAEVFGSKPANTTEINPQNAQRA